MQYNKLVRDKIPDIIKSKGEAFRIRTAEDVEYWVKLKEKLGEEVAELNKDESIEEFADVLEVLDAIAKYKGFDMKQIQEIKAKKLAERGGFEKRVILEES